MDARCRRVPHPARRHRHPRGAVRDLDVAHAGHARKPVVVLDPDGLYAPLRPRSTLLVARGFVRPAARDALIWVTDVGAAFDAIEAELAAGRPPTLTAAPDEVLEADTDRFAACRAVNGLTGQHAGRVRGDDSSELRRGSPNASRSRVRVVHRSWIDRRVTVVRQGEGDPSECLKALGVETPRPVLVLVGGADLMSRDDERKVREVLDRAFVPAAYSVGAIVLDGRHIVWGHADRGRIVAGRR